MKKWSFKLKLLVLSMTCFTALTAVAVALVFNLLKTQKNDFKHSLANYTDTLNYSIGAQFFERYGDVQAFAKNSVFSSDDSTKIESTLNEYVKLYQIYDLIIFTDLDGNVKAVNSKAANGKSLNLNSLSGSNFADKKWFKQLRAKNFTEDASHGFAGTYVEDAHVDKIVSEAYGNDRLINSFSTEVKDSSGVLIGYLSARANFSWVENEFLNVYRQLKSDGLENTELTMLNKRGEVLIDYDPATTGISEIKHNFSNVILKLNLKEKKVSIAEQVLNGKTGVEEAFHARKKIWQIGAFEPVHNSKFIQSIGWGLLLRADRKAAFAEMNASAYSMLSILAIVYIAAVCLLFWFSSSVTRLLSGNVDKLNHQIDELTTLNQSLTSSSHELAGSATEQAAAVQESMSAMEEMSSMMRNAVEYAEQSKVIANEVTDRSQKGTVTMDEMVSSMESIQEVNEKMSEIASIIDEIGQKTNVINDIVFKTQLLSFNASIEAARAGQHGKGFAVVAEEVGNLAQMSGEAAKEISSLLENSKNQVNSIVGETQERVNQGKTVSENVKETFTLIVREIERVAEKISDITSANKEQQQGIEQTSAAVSQMDEGARQVNTISRDSMQLSSSVKNQSEELEKVALDISGAIFGENSARSNVGSRKISTVEKVNIEAAMVPNVADIVPISREPDLDHKDDSFKKIS